MKKCDPATRLLVAFLIFIFITPVYATMGAYNVEVQDKYVSSSARCSCGVGDWYSHITGTFINYCPNCHRYGVLEYEVGPASYTSPEGMWYCLICDMDFCAQCGKSHDRRGKWLVRYVIPPPEPTPAPTPVNQTQVLKDKWLDFNQQQII